MRRAAGGGERQLEGEAAAFLWGCGRGVGGEPERKRLVKKEKLGQRREETGREEAIFCGRRERQLLEEKQRAVPP